MTLKGLSAKRYPLSVRNAMSMLMMKGPVIPTHQTVCVVVGRGQMRIKFAQGKQPIRARYLGHVTGYRPIRDQYFLD